MHKNNLIFNESYHDNCHDYLRDFYINKYCGKKYIKLIRNIKEKIPIIHICNDTAFDIYGETIVCDQHGVIFSHNLDINPVLATYALNACIGLIFYLPKFKVGCIAHIDGLPGYSKESAIEDGITEIDINPIQSNLKMIISIIRDIIPDINSDLLIEFYLIGGIFELSEIMIHDILECITKMGSTNKNITFIFKGRNLLGPENQSRNICFDTRNGKITYFDFLINAEFYKDHFHNGKPMNIISASRQSEALLDITYVPIIKLNDI
jgi:hypothetical protein